MAKNIKFKYIYRDAGNYKNYGYAVFSNPQGISIDKVQNKLEDAFYQQVFFNAQQVDLPELYFEDYPLDDDISFHEFDEVEETDEYPSDLFRRTIGQFLELINSEATKGWKVFDPIERYL